MSIPLPYNNSKPTPTPFQARSLMRYGKGEVTGKRNTNLLSLPLLSLTVTPKIPFMPPHFLAVSHTSFPHVQMTSSLSFFTHSPQLPKALKKNTHSSSPRWEFCSFQLPPHGSCIRGISLQPCQCFF